MLLHKNQVQSATNFRLAGVVLVSFDVMKGQDIIGQKIENMFIIGQIVKKQVPRTGIEPVTLALLAPRSNQLS